MANVREHLQKHHVKSAAFAAQVGGELGKLQKCFATLETLADDTLKEAYGNAAESIGKLAAAFNWQSEYHRSSSASIEKSADVDDLDKRGLVPTQVSAIADPSKVPAGVRAVIRAGQREIPSADMPKVDMQFEHLVKVGDDRE